MLCYDNVLHNRLHNMLHVNIMIHNVPFIHQHCHHPQAHAPPCAASASLLPFVRSSSSIPCSFLTPLLSFCHSDMALLTPAIPPHPEVELVQPTSVASPSAGIGYSSLAVAKSMGQGGRAVSAHKALHQWHCGTRPSTFSALHRYRLGRLVLLALS
jgi:hypothetical protein